MPLFATLVVVCALSAEGDKAACDIAIQDKFQAISQPICFNKVERIRFKAAKDLLERLKDYDLLPGSHNCFNTVAHRDTDMNRAIAAYKKAGITVTITNQDK